MRKLRGGAWSKERGGSFGDHNKFLFIQFPESIPEKSYYVTASTEQWPQQQPVQINSCLTTLALHLQDHGLQTLSSICDTSRMYDGGPLNKYKVKCKFIHITIIIKHLF